MKGIFDVSICKIPVFAPFFSHIYIYNNVISKKSCIFVLCNGLKTN